MLILRYRKGDDDVQSPSEIMGKRIKEKRLALNLTQDELGKIIGVQRAAVNKYESGQVENMKRSIIKNLSLLFEVDPNWLMAFDIDTTESDSDIVAEIKSTSEKLTENRQLKVLNFAKSELDEQIGVIKENNELYAVNVIEKVAAGIGYNYGNNESALYYTGRTDLHPHDMATLVTGDSMEPKFMNGDVVLVKSGYDNVNGDVYVIDYNGKSYVKKLYNDGDRFRLVSINKKYDNIIIDIPIDGDIYFNIVGKVVDSFTPVK